MEHAPQPIFIGIDVSKDRLDVAVDPGGEAFAVGRDAAKAAAAIRRLGPQPAGRRSDLRVLGIMTA